MMIQYIGTLCQHQVNLSYVCVWIYSDVCTFMSINLTIFICFRFGLFSRFYSIDLTYWRICQCLVQDCIKSIADALEILQSCTGPSLWRSHRWPWDSCMICYDIDGLVQDCSNSSTLALELLQCCANPSISTIDIDYTYHNIQISSLYLRLLGNQDGLVRNAVIFMEIPNIVSIIVNIDFESRLGRFNNDFKSNWFTSESRCRLAPRFYIAFSTPDRSWNTKFTILCMICNF